MFSGAVGVKVMSISDCSKSSLTLTDDLYGANFTTVNGQPGKCTIKISMEVVYLKPRILLGAVGGNDYIKVTQNTPYRNLVYTLNADNSTSYNLPLAPADFSIEISISDPNYVIIIHSETFAPTEESVTAVAQPLATVVQAKTLTSRKILTFTADVPLSIRYADFGSSAILADAFNSMFVYEGFNYLGSMNDVINCPSDKPITSQGKSLSFINAAGGNFSGYGIVISQPNSLTNNVVIMQLPNVALNTIQHSLVLNPGEDKKLFQWVGNDYYTSIQTNYLVDYNFKSAAAKLTIYAGCLTQAVESLRIATITNDTAEDFTNLALQGDCRTYLLEQGSVSVITRYSYETVLYKYPNGHKGAIMSSYLTESPSTDESRNYLIQPADNSAVTVTYDFVTFDPTSPFSPSLTVTDYRSKQPEKNTTYIGSVPTTVTIGPSYQQFIVLKVPPKSKGLLVRFSVKTSSASGLLCCSMFLLALVISYLYTILFAVFGLLIARASAESSFDCTTKEITLNDRLIGHSFTNTKGTTAKCTVKVTLGADYLKPSLSIPNLKGADYILFIQNTPYRNLTFWYNSTKIPDDLGMLAPADFSLEISISDPGYSFVVQAKSFAPTYSVSYDVKIPRATVVHSELLVPRKLITFISNTGAPLSIRFANLGFQFPTSLWNMYVYEEKTYLGSLFEVLLAPHSQPLKSNGTNLSFINGDQSSFTSFAIVVAQPYGFPEDVEIRKIPSEKPGIQQEICRPVETSKVFHFIGGDFFDATKPNVLTGFQFSSDFASLTIYAGCITQPTESLRIATINPMNAKNFTNLALHGDCRTYFVEKGTVTVSANFSDPGTDSKVFDGQKGALMSSYLTEPPTCRRTKKINVTYDFALFDGSSAGLILTVSDYRSQTDIRNTTYTSANVPKSVTIGPSSKQSIYYSVPMNCNGFFGEVFGFCWRRPRGFRNEEFGLCYYRAGFLSLVVFLSN
ncbi:unnamed protein product [Caenorhabditis auriculariae]|uniref:Uncharacterized protein n=1 Tax=Caenorhabditis auriculariae TaxID=2777116 RepID=A0A8S1HP13_9PELO|nr:unnamed protein product [Caenorhabditis auriculariae]